MNYSIIRYILGNVILFEGLFLTLPGLVALYYGERQGICFAFLALACLIAGMAIRRAKPKNKIFFAREGFVSVSLSWIFLSVIGAVPFWMTGEIPNFVDALFETISGFTTTGATILTDVEALSRCVAFWRCFTHWIGGMGVLVFILAVLPFSGSNNMHLMRAESPGPSVEKLVPRVKQTAMILYGIYIVITLAEIIVLKLAGLPFFDAVTVSFSTVGTGGFGLYNSSIAAYGHAAQVIIIIFMLLCGINFNVYFLLLKGKIKDAFGVEELKVFLLIVLVATLAITVDVHDVFGSWQRAFHESLFQVSSIITTTGFATADFNLWPQLSRVILMMVLFLGACAGSTGGGFKVSRMIILVRYLKNEIIAAIHPRSIRKVHMNGRVVPDNVVKTVCAFLVAYVFVFGLSILLVSIDGFDFETTVTSVMTTIGNTGPGLAKVGPTGNFSEFGVISKFVLMFDMLAGRLELFPMLVLFYPGTWRSRAR